MLPGYENILPGQTVFRQELLQGLTQIGLIVVDCGAVKGPVPGSQRCFHRLVHIWRHQFVGSQPQEGHVHPRVEEDSVRGGGHLSWIRECVFISIRPVKRKKNEGHKKINRTFSHCSYLKPRSLGKKATFSAWIVKYEGRVDGIHQMMANIVCCNVRYYKTLKWQSNKMSECPTNQKLHSRQITN